MSSVPGASGRLTSDRAARRISRSSTAPCRRRVSAAPHQRAQRRGRAPLPADDAARDRPGAMSARRTVMPRCSLSVDRDRVGLVGQRPRDDLDERRQPRLTTRGSLTTRRGAAASATGAGRVAREQRPHRVGRPRALATSSARCARDRARPSRAWCAGCSARGSRRTPPSRARAPLGHDHPEERDASSTRPRHANHQPSGLLLNCAGSEFDQPGLRIACSAHHAARSMPILLPHAAASARRRPVAMPRPSSASSASATNCFSSRLTSSTDVPLPRAMRLRRLPLMSCVFALVRRHRVDDRLDAAQLLLVELAARRSCFKLPMPGNIPRICSSGPILRIVRS